MKYIALRKTVKTIVDDEDFNYLSKLQIYLNISNNILWAVTKKNGKKIALERLIKKCPKNMEVHHNNRDTLDNRKDNLRIVRHKDNIRKQRLSRANKSGYRGVSKASIDEKRKKKWKAYIGVNGKTKFLGRFYTPEEAAEAYNQNALKYFREFAYINKR